MMNPISATEVPVTMMLFFMYTGKLALCHTVAKLAKLHFAGRANGAKKISLVDLNAVTTMRKRGYDTTTAYAPRRTYNTSIPRFLIITSPPPVGV